MRSLLFVYCYCLSLLRVSSAEDWSHIHTTHTHPASTRHRAAQTFLTKVLKFKERQSSSMGEMEREIKQPKSPDLKKFLDKVNQIKKKKSDVRSEIPRKLSVTNKTPVISSNPTASPRKYNTQTEPTIKISNHRKPTIRSSNKIKLSAGSYKSRKSSTRLNNQTKTRRRYSTKNLSREKYSTHRKSTAKSDLQTKPIVRSSIQANNSVQYPNNSKIKSTRPSKFKVRTKVKKMGPIIEGREKTETPATTVKSEALRRLYEIAGDDWEWEEDEDDEPRRKEHGTVCLKDEGEFSDPFDCSSYFHCVHGNPKRKQCNPGLLWDQDRGLCDWQKNVHCNQKLTQQY